MCCVSNRKHWEESNRWNEQTNEECVFNQSHVLFPAQGMRLAAWQILTVLTMQHTAIFKLIRTPDFHTVLPLFTRDTTWSKKDRNLFNLYLTKEEKFLLFSAHLVSPAAAECSLCLLPELDPQPGECTCWPAPWSASPAHHHLPAHSLEAQEACLGKRWVKVVSRPCAGSCRTAAGGCPSSLCTERAAAGPHCFWLWGSRG